MKLKSRIEEVVNSNPQKKVPNLKIALNNINKDLGMVRTNNPGKLQEKPENTSGALNVSEGSVQKKGNAQLVSQKKRSGLISFPEPSGHNQPCDRRAFSGVER